MRVIFYVFTLFVREISKHITHVSLVLQVYFHAQLQALMIPNGLGPLLVFLLALRVIQACLHGVCISCHKPITIKDIPWLWKTKPIVLG